MFHTTGRLKIKEDRVGYTWNEEACGMHVYVGSYDQRSLLTPGVEILHFYKKLQRHDQVPLCCVSVCMCLFVYVCVGLGGSCSYLFVGTKCFKTDINITTFVEMENFAGPQRIPITKNCLVKMRY